MPNKSHFSLFMDHIFPPFMTAIHFFKLTADNTKNSLLAKNSVYHSLQDNNFRVKGKKNIISVQKYPCLFLVPQLILYTECGFWSEFRGILLKTEPTNILFYWSTVNLGKKYPCRSSWFLESWCNSISICQTWSMAEVCFSPWFIRNVLKGAVCHSGDFSQSLSLKLLFLWLATQRHRKGKNREIKTTREKREKSMCSKHDHRMGCLNGLCTLI